jgi:hypothetical protein
MVVILVFALLVTLDLNVRPIYIQVIISVITQIHVFMVDHVFLLVGLLIHILVCVHMDIREYDVKQVFIPAQVVTPIHVQMVDHVSH